jgi:cytochrome c oxidase subunit I
MAGVMWGEVLGWLATPLLAAGFAGHIRCATAPMMAVATGAAVIGHGVTGLLHGFVGPSTGIDEGLHDTYYVIAQDYFLLQIGALLVLVALPLALIARHLPRPAWLGAALVMLLHLGAGLTFFPQRMMSGGAPRRYVEYEAYFTAVNHLSSLGAAMSFAALSAIALTTLVALYRMGRGRGTR